MATSARSWLSEVNAIDPERAADSVNPIAYEFTKRTFKRREAYSVSHLTWAGHTFLTWQEEDGATWSSF